MAVSEQVEAGRSLEQVFKDFDRDNDGGLDRCGPETRSHGFQPPALLETASGGLPEYRARKPETVFFRSFMHIF